MKMIQSAGFIVYKKKGDSLYFLLLHYNAGHWDFPKGKIEKGESLKEAAERELFEETGLRPAPSDASIDDFVYSFEYGIPEQGIHKKVTLFLTDVNKKQVILSDEHTDYAWLMYQDALARLTHDNARDALRAAYKKLTTPAS